ncbi:extracellular solute-binding protein [Streptomyces radicis]|uniref:Extracellular solute-binding protein n=1 Tax=Streptomyces radicis TaxID=1750517 RepID=A0A3A9WA39_9ACTN|nr:extracellular solute-binding protein [Streptomyces radicis]RKN23257.1 extracellular solute-binding protein [Streptomyces radicis]
MLARGRRGRGADRHHLLVLGLGRAGDGEPVQRHTRRHPGRVRADTRGDIGRLLEVVQRRARGQGPRCGDRGVPAAADVRHPERRSAITDFGVAEIEDQYPEWAWSQVELGGEVYSLPKDIAPQALFYRADLFEEYGLEPPGTWEEFRDLAERVRAERPGVSLSTIQANDAGLVAGLAWQAGADWFDTSTGTWRVDTADEPSLAMARYWDGLITEGLVVDEPLYSESHVTDLQQGCSLTLIGALWSAANISRFVPELAGRWGVAPVPAWDEPAAGNYGGSTMALPEGAPHPDAAMEFARWVSTSPDAIAAAAPASTAFPANTTLTEVWGEETERANTFVRGMDLPRVASEAAATVDPSWEWGPSMAEGFNRLNDETAALAGTPGGLQEALRRWQDVTVELMRQRGFEVVD